jgi:effector-binding domain-containing protein
MEEPTRKKLEPMTVICRQHQGSYDEIGGVYGELYEWARSNGVNTAGDGFTVFLSPPSELDWNSALFEVCVPVESAPEGHPDVSVKEIPGCAVASAVVKGPYSEIPAHYTEMLAWLSTMGLAVAGPPREVYLKRPGADGSGDPEEFLTEIQFPISDEG